MALKLLLLGARSQLGQSLEALLQESAVEHQCFAFKQGKLPKRQEVIKAISRFKPSQVINVASYSNLVAAEHDPDAARQCDILNTEVVADLAETCHKLDIPLLHHSSSYVFDGQKLHPYEEDDETNPICRYGLSKWYGERAIRDSHQQHIILRTGWMFSAARHQLFSKHIEVCKQSGGRTEAMEHRFSPTPAADVARVILAIAQQLDCNAEAWGTYHYSALQPISEGQFVEAFLKEAAQYDPALAALADKLEVVVRKLEPPYIGNTTLGCQKIMETFGIQQRSRAGEVTEILKMLSQE